MDLKSLLQRLVETESPTREKVAVDRVGSIVAVHDAAPVITRAIGHRADLGRGLCRVAAPRGSF